MPYKPDRLVNKTAKLWQNIIFCIAGFFGFITLGHFLNGSGDAFITLIITIALFWGGSNIKTTYTHKGGVDFYK